MPEGALITRHFYRLGDGQMVLRIERWDTGHPDCPFAFVGMRPHVFIDKRLISIKLFELMFGKGAAKRLPMLH